MRIKYNYIFTRSLTSLVTSLFCKWSPCAISIFVIMTTLFCVQIVVRNSDLYFFSTFAQFKTPVRAKQWFLYFQYSCVNVYIFFYLVRCFRHILLLVHLSSVWRILPLLLVPFTCSWTTSFSRFSSFLLVISVSKLFVLFLRMVSGICIWFGMSGVQSFRYSKHFLSY